MVRRLHSARGRRSNPTPVFRWCTGPVVALVTCASLLASRTGGQAIAIAALGLLALVSWLAALRYRLLRARRPEDGPHFLLTALGLGAGLTAADLVGGGLLVKTGPLLDTIVVVLVAYGLVKRFVASS